MVFGCRLQFFLLSMLCCLGSYHNGVSAMPMVVLTGPNNFINEGDTVQLQCDVTNLQTGYYIEWVRKDQSGDVILGSNGLSTDSRFTLETLSSTLQSRSERIAIRNIDKMENSYECRVTDAAGNNLANQIVAFQVRFFPDDMYPVCNPAGEFTVQQGTMQTISCTTERSNPPSQMAITTTGGADVVSDWTFTEDSVTFEGNFSKEQTWTVNVHFKCIISSPAFPNKESSCYIGPVTVIGGGNNPSDMATNTTPQVTPSKSPETTPEVAATQQTTPSSAPVMSSKFHSLTLLVTSFSLIVGLFW